MKIISFVICCLFCATLKAQVIDDTQISPASGHSQHLTAKNTSGKKPSSMKYMHNSNPLSKEYNTLYQLGIGESFIGGLYDAHYPLAEMKAHGDFGLGAPGLLDGELLMYKGHAYQTHSTGLTEEVPPNFKCALGFVTFFKPDTIFHISSGADQKAAYEEINSYLKQSNGAWAIRISGTFTHLKTRAFPPYTQKPYPPLATLLSRQKFFELHDIKGSLIGFKLPAYMGGISIEGYHFHFLSDDKTRGGHMISFTGRDLTVEIASLKKFILSIPQDQDAMGYDFKKPRNDDMNKVEKGH